jgi:hypothetical protein
VRSAKKYVQGALEALLSFGIFLFWLVILLSPALLAATIASVVYGLFSGETNPDPAMGLIMGSIIYVFIASQLSKLTPEGHPGLDLVMTTFLTVVGGALALFALTTPWWAWKLLRTTEMAEAQSILLLSLFLMILGIASAYVVGREAWRFHSRYKAHYPQLGDVLRNLKGPDARLAEETLGAVRRGQVAFLYNDDEKVTHVLVGQALFPVRPGRKRYSPGNIREAPDEELVEYLQKRTGLSALPPERILALLRERGNEKDLEEVERAWAMERLSEF